MSLQVECELDTGRVVSLTMEPNDTVERVISLICGMERSRSNLVSDFSIDENDLSLMLMQKKGNSEVENLIAPHIPLKSISMRGRIKIFGVKRCHERSDERIHYQINIIVDKCILFTSPLSFLTRQTTVHIILHTNPNTGSDLQSRI